MRMFYFVICLFLSTSCNFGNFSTGSQFFDELSFEFNVSDTLTINFSSVKLDSIITSYPNRFIIGNSSDTVFGITKSSAFTQVFPASANYEFDLNDVNYNRITLLLTYDNYFLNDTTNAFTLIIDELDEEMELDDETNSFYNTSNFKVKSEIPDGIIIGSEFLFSTRPLSGETLELTLDNGLGLRLFNEALESDNVYSNTDEFLDFFKGIKISSSFDTNAFLGFKTGVEIRVYYEDLTVVPSEEKYISLTNSNLGELFFNQIESDYTNTALNTLTSENNSISSQLTNDLAYMQSGVGLGIRIEIPYVKKILEDNPNLLIEQASLYLKPVKNLYDDKLLPPYFFVYYVDGNNELISDGAYQLNLTLDDELDKNTYYSIDITEFIEFQLSNVENNQNALFIVSNEEIMSNSVHYMSFGNQNNNDLKAEINLNLIQLKQ